MRAHQIKRREIESLEQLRGELEVQAALFKAEVKSEWVKLEDDWRVLKRQFSPVNQAAKQTALDVESATELLFETVKAGYERIKRTLH